MDSTDGEIDLFCQKVTSEICEVILCLQSSKHIVWNNNKRLFVNHFTPPFCQVSLMNLQYLINEAIDFCSSFYLLHINSSWISEKLQCPYHRDIIQLLKRETVLKIETIQRHLIEAKSSKFFDTLIFLKKKSPVIK
ncbi:MAG: hypothetical protein MHPSP_001364 [Paramarteilia canceri]